MLVSIDRFHPIRRITPETGLVRDAEVDGSPSDPVMIFGDSNARRLIFKIPHILGHQVLIHARSGGNIEAICRDAAFLHKTPEKKLAIVLQAGSIDIMNFVTNYSAFDWAARNEFIWNKRQQF